MRLKKHATKVLGGGGEDYCSGREVTGIPLHVGQQ